MDRGGTKRILRQMLRQLLQQEAKINSSYYGWACSPAVFAWKRGIWPKRLTFMRFHMETAELQAQP